jgi:hypothetical protein
VKNGLLIAQEMEYIFDSGAYGAYRPQDFSWARTKRRDHRIPNTHI